MPFRSFARLASLSLLAAAALACSSNSVGESDAGGTVGCPVSPGCPDTGGPSYAKDILPILDQDCLPCHSASGTAGYDESTYAKVFAQRSPMLDQVSACMMPPVNGPVMTAAQRVAMTAWFECGAPNN